MLYYHHDMRFCDKMFARLRIIILRDSLAASECEKWKNAWFFVTLATSSLGYHHHHHYHHHYHRRRRLQAMHYHLGLLTKRSQT